MGSISSTFYVQILRSQIPNAQKKQSSWQCCLALLGPTSVKAVCKTLMKLSHGGERGTKVSQKSVTYYLNGSLPHQVTISPTYLRSAFMLVDPKSVKRLTTWLSFLRFWAPRAWKLYVECWWNSAQGLISTTF